jgi:peptidoglycan/xylan/chitin deacetylase (PgdA/CDA1 family)
VPGEALIPVVVPAAGSLGAALGLFLHGMFSPSSRLMGPIVVRGPANSGKVALTFDDGPTEGTMDVLDALREARCSATFFCIGRNVEKFPAVVQRAVREGHLLANHSFDHSRQSIWRRRWYWVDQVTRTEAALTVAGAPRDTSRAFFRPPMGFKSWRMVVACSKTGHQMVTWSLRGMDGVQTTSQAIRARLLPRARAGDIIALHDGAEPGKSRSPAATVEALPEIIRGLRAKGLEPVRLDELLGITGNAGQPRVPTVARATRGLATNRAPV